MSDDADRTRADLAGAVEVGTADDDATLPHAGTAVLVRDRTDRADTATAGVEVLLLRRPDRGSFGGAWVFPGGRVEETDIRPGAGAAADARRAAARETVEEVGLHIAADALAPLSIWVPPHGVRTRVLTWFFLGTGAEGTLHPSADETTAVAWLRPEQALADHAAGRLALYPPTWVTLHGLCGADSAASVVDAAHSRAPARFASVVRRGAAGPVFAWQPDVACDTGMPLDAPGPRHRLDTGTLPWRYTRDV